MPKHKTTSPSPIDIHVGNRLRKRRRMVGISQEKLGEALGLTFQQIQKYEKGINMGASRLQQAADILGVPVPFFFEGGADGLSSRTVVLLRPPTSRSSFQVRKGYGSPRRSCR